LKPGLAADRLPPWFGPSPDSPNEKTRRFDRMQNDHTEALADQDPEYRRLHDEHRNHEERLQVLAAKSRLSEDEEIEEKRLKKEKLLIKDKMEEIARTHREGVAH
jgi:uncharacterized protein YdcH (DUF465 family)